MTEPCILQGTSVAEPRRGSSAKAMASGIAARAELKATFGDNRALKTCAMNVFSHFG